MWLLRFDCDLCTQKVSCLLVIVEEHGALVLAHLVDGKGIDFSSQRLSLGSDATFSIFCAENEPVEGRVLSLFFVVVVEAGNVRMLEILVLLFKLLLTSNSFQSWKAHIQIELFTEVLLDSLELFWLRFHYSLY